MITPDYDIQLGELDSFSAKRFKREKAFVDRNEQINAKLPITISGGLTRVGRGSVLLDGSNDLIDCTNDATLWSQSLTKFSFSLWIYPTIEGDASIRRVVQHGSSVAQGFLCFKEQNNTVIDFAVKNSVGTEFVAKVTGIVGNMWHHIACVYDNSLGTQNLKIYHDTVVGATTGNLTEAVNLSATLQIADSSNDFKGNGKDFRG